MSSPRRFEPIREFDATPRSEIDISKDLIAQLAALFVRWEKWKAKR
jgi:hypothetical protein